MWYEEYKETFEFIKSEPELSFLPTEVKLFNYSYVTNEKLLIFLFSASGTNILLPESIRFNGIV